MTDIRTFPYLAVSAVAGILFGCGMYFSQMIDPLKVLGFLDFSAIPSGNWDPSLAFVFLGATGVMMIGVQASRGWKKPVLDTQFFKPDKTQIDAPLIIGAAIFGIGWGMSGACPGPLVSLIALLPEGLLIFVVSVLAGSFIGIQVQKKLA